MSSRRRQKLIEEERSIEERSGKGGSAEEGSEEKVKDQEKKNQMKSYHGKYDHIWRRIDGEYLSVSA